jgi:hypothetical protein
MTRITEATAAKKTHSAGSATPQVITAAFDRSFPWRPERHAINGDNSDIKLPASSKVTKMPGEAGKLLKAVTESYTTVNGYQLSLAGQKIYTILGQRDSSCGVALFNSRGKELAFSDVLGLNEWQYDAKGNARNMALGAGLPGAPRVRPVKPLSPSAKALTEAFDAKYPWDNQTDSVHIPDQLSENNVPSSVHNTKLSRMYDSKSYDATWLYQIELNGKHVFTVIGVADDQYDIGLFNLKGDRIGFNSGDGWTV